LLAEGRGRLVYVGGETGIATFQDAEREAGFREALEAAHVAPPRRLAGPYSYEGGLAAAAVLCVDGAANCADGIFVANDIMAFGVIDGLRRAGVAIPVGTSIVGFDDLPQARWIGYDLSTVRQPIDALVTAALEILDRRVEDEDAPAESVFVAAELVQRGTTR
jgi:DNA-binding LacI/PurR family transcriptional regulator